MAQQKVYLMFVDSSVSMIIKIKISVKSFKKPLAPNPSTKICAHFSPQKLKRLLHNNKIITIRCVCNDQFA